MKTLSIRFKSQTLKGRVEIPASKSVSNRLLVLAYIASRQNDAAKAESAAALQDASRYATAEDTVRMRQLLEKIAAAVAAREADAREARGAARKTATDARKTKTKAAAEAPVTLDCGNAGTVLRFLTALLALEPGLWRIDGNARMKERPIGPLVESLRKIGANIAYEGRAGYPPLLIKGIAPDSITSDVWEVEADTSSQYVSALMMAACRVKDGARVHLSAEKVVSQPYIYMTADLMRACGVEVFQTWDGDFKGIDFWIRGPIKKLPQGGVEPDWSSASYFYGLLALSKGGDMLLPGFQKESCQGDKKVAEWFEAFGIESRFEAQGLRLIKKENRHPERLELDLTAYPDLAPTMAVVGAACGVETRLTGLQHLHHKETDRLAALVTELNRMQVKAEARFSSEKSAVTDTLYIPATEREVASSAPSTTAAPPDNPSAASSKSASSPKIHTYGDHRMAMAFSIWGMLRPIEIENPEVVIKSYDGYWSALESLGACLTELA